MSIEALRIRLDSIGWEKDQLVIENQRLRESNPETAQLVNLEAELEESREEIERLTKELEGIPRLEQELNTALQEMERFQQQLGAAASQGTAAAEVERLRQELLQVKLDAEEARRYTAESDRRATEVAQTLEHEANRIRELEIDSARVQLDAELQRYRLLEAERSKWEAREERMAEQIAELKELLQSSRTECDRLRAAELRRSSDDVYTTTQGSADDDTLHQREQQQESQSAHEMSGLTKSLPQVTERRQDVRGDPTTVQLSQALLAQQLPQVSKFTGEERQQSGETFEDWKEQFEMVATLSRWDEKVKLVNLVTRLRGQAYAFYRSCTLQQRADYNTLVGELAKRFTPVQLHAVQSSQFHERKQKPQESVDDYAQDLRHLFHRAYPKVQQGSKEAEEMGRLLLTNQFVTGLHPELKGKVAGVEGEFDHILAKARFEEAKRRDLSRPSVALKSPYHGLWESGQSPMSQRTRNADMNKRVSYSPAGGQRPEIKCFNCGAGGHIARECPKQRRSYHPEEARGRPTTGSQQNRGRVATVVQESKQGEANDSLLHLQNPGIEEALDQATATMHGLSPVREYRGQLLGPTIMVQVELEGTPVQALLDTGSPTTIVSLELIVQVLAAQKPSDQAPDQWKADMSRRLEPSAVSLRSYGGAKLDLIRQVQVSLSRQGYQTQAVVQVQKDAPVGLLLGTDLIPQLSFAVLESNGDGLGRDLLQNRTWLKAQTTSEAPTTSSLEDDEAIPISEKAPGSSLGPQVQRQEGEPQLSIVDKTASENPAPKEVSQPRGVVRLLQAVRLPARHQKLLRARVEGPHDCHASEVSMFEPGANLRDVAGLNMAEAVVRPDESGIVTLVLENAAYEPTRLKKGRVLGQLFPATLSSSPGSASLQANDEPNPPEEQSGPMVAHTQPDEKLADRTKRLLEEIPMEADILSKQEKEQLRTFLTEHEKVFALDTSELGTTNVVTHSIETE